VEKRPSGLNAWTTPNSLLGIIGFVALVIAGYQQFQSDTAKDIAVLQEKMRSLEKQIEGMQREQRADAREGGQ
jgi:type II secretory pathway pseudopilin PulG